MIKAYHYTYTPKSVFKLTLNIFCTTIIQRGDSMKKIAIVGHPTNITRIEQVLSDEFINVKGHPIEVYEMSQITTTITYIKEHIDDFDGIIFTGISLYDIMNHNIHSQNPWVYIANDDSQLQRALLEASHKKNLDISKISIDSFTEERIKTIYNDFGITPNEYSVKISSIDPHSKTFIKDLFNFHKNSFKINPNQIAITGISTVYTMLQNAQIPSMLLVPNKDSIRNTLHNLLEKIKLKDMTINQIVVISMEIDMNNEYDLLSENEYSIMLQRTKITEEVYKFAQRIQAAVIEFEKSYLLFTTKQIVEYETNQLRELTVLSAIKKKADNTVSVGIGFGITAREAKANAVLGKNKSLKMGGNQCFVVYSKSRMERITQLKQILDLPVSDLPFKEISEKSGISVNNIYRLKCIMDIYKKDTFTSHELCDEFGNSLRSMNRIVERLEQAGYIKVIGRKIIGKAGRPSRILKLLI